MDDEQSAAEIASKLAPVPSPTDYAQPKYRAPTMRDRIADIERKVEELKQDIVNLKRDWG